MAFLEIKNVSKSFAALKAVDNVSYSIEDGDVLGVPGPNGAGKNTTNRMIMNIIVPDSGSVTLLKNSEENTTNLIG